MTLATWTNDQVFNQLDSGSHWSGSTITYSFATSASAMYGSFGSGFSALSAAGQNSAKLALALWDDLIAPDMQQAQSGNSYTSTNIEIGMSSSVGYGYTYYPTAGSMWLDSDYTSGSNSLTSPTIDLHGFYTYIHELGHSLGLEHSGNYDLGTTLTASNYRDSTVYSVMSYLGPSWNKGSGEVAWADWIGSDGKRYEPQTPMLDDIMAVQRIYGAETTTRTGDTVYGFNSNITDVTSAVYNFSQNAHPILTIYDSAGNDTLDLSGWSTPSTINLAPGSFSSANAMTSNIAIANSTNIENAVGGGGADNITGNTLNNRLAGGAGDDVLAGVGGNDTLTGGTGNDTIDGGDGTDTVNLGDSWSNLGWSLDPTTGYLSITSALDGVDQIKNVEYFVDSNNVTKSLSDLTGTTVAPPPPPPPPSDPTPPPPYAATVSIATGTASQAEGTGASTVYHFTATLSQASTEVESVGWTLSFGTGSGQADATDFAAPLFGTATFAAGQTSTSIDITVVGDSVVESDEAFKILLSSPSIGVTLATSNATGLIVNDDVQPVAPPPVQGGGVSLIGTSTGETLTGGAGSDTLMGMGGNDTLKGGDGDDLLDGGAGADQLKGSVGDDIYIVDNVGDTITEYANEGFDTIRTSLSNYTLASNVERLEYTGTAANVGPVGDGLAAPDSHGRGGWHGARGDLQGEGAKPVHAAGDTVQTVTVQTVTVQGFAGTGNNLANTIISGSGNDTLDGGGGSDTLDGGAGADKFVFDSSLGSGNIDTIIHFDATQDDILLENAIFRVFKATGALSTGAFTVGTAATEADDRIIYDDHTGELYFDSDGTGSAKAVQFATLDPGLHLTSANFEII